MTDAPRPVMLALLVALVGLALPAHATAADASTSTVRDSLTYYYVRQDAGAIDRLYRTTEHIPVELATSHFLPSQYSYRVKLRRTLR